LRAVRDARRWHPKSTWWSRESQPERKVEISPTVLATTLDTVLRALSALALLVAVVVAVLVLRTRHLGTMRATTAQEVTVVCAAVVGLLAGA